MLPVVLMTKIGLGLVLEVEQRRLQFRILRVVGVRIILDPDFDILVD